MWERGGEDFFFFRDKGEYNVRKIFKEVNSGWGLSEKISLCFSFLF